MTNSGQVLQYAQGKTAQADGLVDALVHYLAIRDGTPGPLCLLPNNQPLTRASFNLALNKAFQELHMDHHSFNIHSFLELVSLHPLNVPG